jgi:hypothetical protein
MRQHLAVTSVTKFANGSALRRGRSVNAAGRITNKAHNFSVGMAGSLKSEHHFGLDVCQHMALQASLMHSINGVSLLSYAPSGASALIAGAGLRGTTCFAGRATEAVLGDRLCGIIWFA